jgi:hypothetical protein
VHTGRIEPCGGLAKRWGQGMRHLKTVIYPQLGSLDNRGRRVSGLPA